MTFATPWLAAIAAAIAVPALVILYFLKLRRKNVEVSTTLLWKKAIEDLQANAPFQKLRKNILLLLQLLALAAALFALAQPQTETVTGVSNRHVLLIDRSASMAARDGSSDGLTRLEAVKQAALDQIDNLAESGVLQSGRSDEAMVIAFDKEAEVIQRFTTDKQALRRAVERIEQTDVPGSISEAFNLAQAHRPRRLLRDDAGGTQEATLVEIEGQTAGEPQTFHLFTDGRFADADTFTPRSDDEVIFHAVGDENAANVGIVGLRAERAYDNPDKLSVFVALQNASDTARPVELELKLDDQTVAVRDLELPAATVPEAEVESSNSERIDDTEVVANVRPEPGTGGLVFELDRPEAALAEVRVRTKSALQGDLPRDAFPTDDVGRLAIPPAKRTTVAVVTAGNLFLVEALGGLPLAKLQRFTPAQFNALPEDQRTAFDVVVLDGVLPPDIPDGRALPPGRWLVLGAIPEGPETFTDAGEAPGGRFLDWSRDHPILRNLTLQSIFFGAIRKAELTEDSVAQVIADTPFGPGILEVTALDYRAIVTTFAPDNSNWPFDISFVAFFAGAIQDLAGTVARVSDDQQREAAPGEILADRVPAGATAVRVRLPDGSARDLEPSPDGRVAYGPLRQTGLYTLEWSGDAGLTDIEEGNRVRRRFAVNLLDPRESDVAAQSAVALATEVTAAASDGEVQSIRRYWPWLLAAMLAIMLFEWYVYNRKVYL
ncbi:MAG: VWA domain-containing protein [Planctomycetota bacterium]